MVVAHLQRLTESEMLVFTLATTPRAVLGLIWHLFISIYCRKNYWMYSSISLSVGSLMPCNLID